MASFACCSQCEPKWEPSEVRTQDSLAASSSWVATRTCDFYVRGDIRSGGKSLEAPGWAGRRRCERLRVPPRGCGCGQVGRCVGAGAVPLTGSPGKGGQRCAEVAAAGGHQRRRRGGSGSHRAEGDYDPPLHVRGGLWGEGPESNGKVGQWPPVRVRCTARIETVEAAVEWVQESWFVEALQAKRCVQEDLWFGTLAEQHSTLSTCVVVRLGGRCLRLASLGANR